MVYLIHFDEPYKHAQHYIGFTEHFDERMDCHKSGTGSRLLEVVNKAGIGWKVVRTWEGDRKLERKLKNQKKASRLCPVCKAKSKGCEHVAQT